LSSSRAHLTGISGTSSRVGSEYRVPLTLGAALADRARVPDAAAPEPSVPARGSGSSAYDGGTRSIVKVSITLSVPECEGRFALRRERLATRRSRFGVCFCSAFDMWTPNCPLMKVRHGARLPPQPRAAHTGGARPARVRFSTPPFRAKRALQTRGTRP